MRNKTDNFWFVTPLGPFEFVPNIFKQVATVAPGEMPQCLLRSIYSRIQAVSKNQVFHIKKKIDPGYFFSFAASTSGF